MTRPRGAGTRLHQSSRGLSQQTSSFSSQSRAPAATKRKASSTTSTVLSVWTYIESLPHLPTSMAVSIYKCRQGRPPASIYMLPAGTHSSGVCTSLNPLKLHVRCPVIACMQPLSSGTSSTGWTRMATASSMLTSSCHAPRTWYETLNAEPALCHSMRMYTVPMLALWHIGNLH